MNRGHRYSVESGHGEVAEIERLVSELGPLVTVPIAAWLVRCSDTAIRRRIARQTLSVVFIGGSPWVPLREVVQPVPQGWTLANYARSGAADTVLAS